ncbi:MAG: hypothetical protein COA65_09090 [Rhodospirillaceae bacterium]|nr:MAG: hypothetical protein COA65_09090 [Rhodospirillaceae bacterium]
MGALFARFGGRVLPKKTSKTNGFCYNAASIGGLPFAPSLKAVAGKRARCLLRPENCFGGR